MLGSGTINDPYQVVTLADFYSINSNMSAYYIQTQDIVLGDNFSPIGGTNNTTPVIFTGNYDAQGYALKNGNKYSFSKDFDYVAIFRKIQNATIKNLYIKNIQIINFSNEGYTGFVAGLDVGGSTITNVHIDIDCKLRADDNYAGGIIGRLAAGSLIENCSNNADKISAYLYTGGICGHSSGTIKNCYNSSYITTVQWGTGGICGYNTATGIVQYCVNVGLIKYSGSSTGGISGHVEAGGSCTNCFSLASKLVIGGNRVCSVSTGLNNNYALDTMTSTYVLNNKVLNGKDGADITQANAMKKINYTNNGFTFTDNSGYWSINEDTGYAYINSDYSFYQRSIPYSGGEGTTTNPYLISNLSDLKNIGDLFYIYEYNSYKQTNDITLGNDFTPIGFNTSSPYYYYFFGHYNGQGFKIKNGTINKQNNDYVGIFANTYGTICNLTISNVQVTGKNNVGAIAGFSKSVIYNVKINETCSVTGNTYVGGVYGWCKTDSQYSDSGTNFHEVSNKANISGVSSVGGLVGYYYFWDNDYSTIRNCYNAGNITASSSAAGGLVGKVWMRGWLGSTQYFKIQKSYNSGNISTISNGSGLVGNLVKGENPGYCSFEAENSFNLCESITRISGTATSFYRIWDSSNTITNCYSLNTTMPDGHVYESTLTGRDGLDITLETAKLQTTYTNRSWDFTTIWKMATNGFPYLYFEPAPIFGNKFTINDEEVSIHITSFNDNFNISFSEDKVNSESTCSHLVFNGNKRKTISLECYCNYETYVALQEASEQYFLISAFVSDPKNTNINLLENESFYISKLNTNFKKGDENNFYISLELIKSTL